MEYDTVVISGLPLAGTSTLKRALADRWGWESYSAGEYWRELYDHLYPDRDKDFSQFVADVSAEEHLQLDYWLREIIAGKQVVVDARNGFLHGDAGTLYVFVTADRATRVQRASNRDDYHGIAEQAIWEDIGRREADELALSRLVSREFWGKSVHYTDGEWYAEVLDTSAESGLTLEEEVWLIEERLRSGW